MHALRTLIADRIRQVGPISVAEYMSLALYHPEYGYYARVPRRTGRAGDFFTSVDVGPLFGELLARQLAEMWTHLDQPGNRESRFDLVEAGAGDGRLARDILDAAAAAHPDFYQAIRLWLIEASPAARAAQARTLGPHAGKMAAAEPVDMDTHGTRLPSQVRGAILANELLDALPTHVVVMRSDGLKEIHVDLDAPAGDRADQEPDGDGAMPPIGFVERELPPSTPDLAAHLARRGAVLEPGWRAEITLRAVDWVREAAHALDRGFLLCLDYGHEAHELYSETHRAGTLTTFAGHAGGDAPALLEAPGDCDITAHVDLTTVTATAEEAGLTTLGKLDQTYFLLALALQGPPKDALREDTVGTPSDTTANLRRRLALKTLTWPGGLGSTLKVLLFGKGVGTPRLQGLSQGVRLT